MMSLFPTSEFFREWRPLEVFRGESGLKFSLIILNQPLDEYGEVVLELWKKACIRSTTDGGTNQLYKFVQSIEGELDSYLPDLITGDFDSITPDVLEFYKTKGSTIIHTPDQDQTDFTKCLKLVLQTASDKGMQVDYVVVAVNNTGRFDHIMANINTLYLIKTDVPVYLLSKGSLTWLLQSGSHRIVVDENVMNSTCGLIPMGEPCKHVTTTGLQWNLKPGVDRVMDFVTNYSNRMMFGMPVVSEVLNVWHDQCLEFGNLISTSNTYDDGMSVTVNTDKPLLWTMEVR